MKTYKYKVVFLGNYEVGKTTLFRRLKGSSQDDSSSTDSLEMPPFTLEYQITERLQVIVRGLYSCMHLNIAICHMTSV